MGARLVPHVLSGAFVLLLAVSFGAEVSRAETAPVVVGSVRCLDCSPNDVNAEDAFKGTRIHLVIAMKTWSFCKQENVIWL